MIIRTIADGHVWLRLTQAGYEDPFDMSYAQRRGGRWNPPNSWPTLYLNEDMTTVLAQVRHLFVGRGIEPDDLDDNAPIQLAAATLPRRQRVADVVSSEGIAAVGLPPTYPLGNDGILVTHDTTQPIGLDARRAGLRGVWCRSAALVGNEFAWFPTGRVAARPYWERPKPFGSWRHARTIADVD